jgi:type I restriction enzyme S subunit
LCFRVSTRNGAFGIIPDHLDAAVVSNDFPVFSLDTRRIDPAYLNWLSTTRDFIDLCRTASEGTTNRVRLKEDRFLATCIPLPPLAEQRRIVARVEALAAKVESARGLRQQTEAEADALLSAGARQIFASMRKAEYQPLRELVGVRGGGTPSKADPTF